ncbi:MAG TPA: chemotaxis protein CheX [bacterium]|nr:chemotaxis protein CheX [bacterium]
MKAEQVIPFAEAAVSVLREMLGSDVTRGDLAMRTKVIPTRGIAVIIGVVGQLRGRVVFDLDTPTALKLAAQLNGEEFTAIDPLVQSTLNEIANISSGRAVGVLCGQGCECDITPPVLLHGDTVTVTTDLPALAIPLHTACGELIINVAVRD